MGSLKLNLSPKQGRSAAAPAGPPRGSFTVDANGRVLSSTVPQGFPEPMVQEIAGAVLAVFRSAVEAQLRLTEFTAHYAALRVTAREMRGGAIVYLAPRGPA